MKVDKRALKGALEGWFVMQKGRAKRKRRKRKSKKQFKADLAWYRRALKKVTRARNLMIKTRQKKTRAFELVVHRIIEYTKMIKKMSKFFLSRLRIELDE